VTERPTLDAYPFRAPITTRWSDNDIYGHVNNVTYYSYFDSAANLFLIREGGLDIATGGVIGLVVESHCQFHAPVTYPEELVAGVRVDKLGNRAVTYGLAIFAAGSELAAASGYVVHVFVDRQTRKAVPIPDGLRAALARIQPQSSSFAM
jgi:acyl-CoA thioester hydrolase